MSSEKSKGVLKGIQEHWQEEEPNSEKADSNLFQPWGIEQWRSWIRIGLFSHSVVSNSLQPRGLEHSRLPCLSPTFRAYSNSYPTSRWCHPTISSFFVPFSSCLQSFPASGSFLMSQLFASGGQTIGASASASVPPMNIQNLFPLGWTGCISLQTKRLSRIFSNTTVQKHQLFGAQLSFKLSITQSCPTSVTT